MKRILNRPLLLSVLLALLGGGAAYGALSDAGRVGIAGAEVRVVHAAKPIAVGQRITLPDVELRAVPASAIPADAARSLDEVVGRYATLPMLKGEGILAAKTSDRTPGSNLAALIPPGSVAVSVAISDVVSTGRFIAPGDRVDVLGVVTKDAGDRADLVLRDVTVLAVASNLIGSELPPPAAAQRTSVRDNPRSLDATVTLAVTVEEARRLVQVDEIGKLRLALRSRGADSAVNQRPTGP